MKLENKQLIHSTRNPNSSYLDKLYTEFIPGVFCYCYVNNITYNRIKYIYNRIIHLDFIKM